MVPVKEEGIFRLSGSSAEIQRLKDRFNSEIDVDILGGSAPGDGNYDVHAVAGLLKLWFRELGSPVLTDEMQPHFLYLTELKEREHRISALKRLLSHLPRSNYTLLRVLFGYLISIVQNHSINKMTSRNVGIVFAPTLSIPSAVFTLMMSEFSTLFIWDGMAEAESDREAYAQAVDAALRGVSMTDGEQSVEVPRRRTKNIDKARRVELSHSLLGGEFDDVDFGTDPSMSNLLQQSEE
ncbi:MAG: hypothetical protein SGCHY_002600 [Lobulomycetales sp.]